MRRWSASFDRHQGSGRQLLIREMLAITREPGGGWVDYKWPNPLTHKIQDSQPTWKKLGDRYFVGSGSTSRKALSASAT